ncbi:hypothetical protein EDB84DRAFT_1620348 [Lactarius hengduanensis]|nr:hypothetical protein EDB84DRAFT_1620348 [Lactarius hengduanensis]
MYQQREHQFQQLTRDYNGLRTSHEELTKSHKKVVEAYIEASNTLTTRNQESDHSSTRSLGSPETDPSTWQLMRPLVRSDYPLVKFWTKLAWKVHSDTINDSSNLVPGDNRRGGTRSAQGINVMMLYIENADGTSINGTVAGEIRDFARSIWHGLLLRKAAPPTWGGAPMDVREHYYYDMEVEFEVLRYCEGHWKAQAIATSIYSQWHGTFVKKRGAAVKEEDNTETAQATSTKRPRLASSDNVSESPLLRKNVAGSVTVSPSTVPRSPAKTPKNTAIRRSPSDIAEEETQVMRLVAESTRPTKAESRDYFITTMEALRDSWK